MAFIFRRINKKSPTLGILTHASLFNIVVRMRECLDFVADKYSVAVLK